MMISQQEMENSNELIVNEPAIPQPGICGNVIRVCDPEDWFEMIEQCKICGRCI